VNHLLGPGNRSRTDQFPERDNARVLLGIETPSMPDPDFEIEDRGDSGWGLLARRSPVRGRIGGEILSQSDLNTWTKTFA
jgi:hypothetical protein